MLLTFFPLSFFVLLVVLLGADVIFEGVDGELLEFNELQLTIESS